LPLVVLVNGKTASAAEIVAACVQDHGRAVVVGERTFGQGIVRGLLPLKDGVGSLKLPVASYFRPSGKTMNRYPGATESDDWGVSPDPGYEVVLTEEEIAEFQTQRSARENLTAPGPSAAQFRDRQLQKAQAYLQDRLAKR
jgi:carboxyl-terminal processing protease